MSECFTCSKCKVSKESAFFPYAKGTRHSWCRACHKTAKAAYHAAYRAANPRKKRITADIVQADGRYICSKCRSPKSPDQFQRGTIGGWCQECKTQKEKERRLSAGMVPTIYSLVTETHKECSNCKLVLEQTCFTKSERGSAGLASICKVCSRLLNQTRYKNPAKAAEHTRAYRERHPERTKANHRIHQAKRRLGIEVTADGSITDDFLKGIYATENCHYCKKPTENQDRTIEHRLPLSRGGAHTATNIAMACASCNCSKGSKTEEEFLMYKSEIATTNRRK